MTGQIWGNVQHFKALNQTERDRLFLVTPETLDDRTDSSLLAVALGATLYSPANRSDLAKVFSSSQNEVA
jgi:hypothetical protein